MLMSCKLFPILKAKTFHPLILRLKTKKPLFTLFIQTKFFKYGKRTYKTVKFGNIFKV